MRSAALGAGTRPSAPLLFGADLWPHRSLSRRGFVWVLLLATVGFSIPLFALIGEAAFWFVGAFCLIDLALLYGLTELTYRSGRVREEVRVWPERIQIDRFDPSGEHRSWSANPYWVNVRLLSTQRIQDYLVLACAGREIELGAFLAPEERRSLAAALRQALEAARRFPAAGS